MKNVIVNKITAIVLTLIMVFALVPSAGFAQTNPASPINEVKGFNAAVFDSHFSRADREINPERWLAEAKIGITQAVYAWELIAFGMYENPFLFEEAKTKLEDWGEKELEARFSQWLNKRFFGEALGKAVSEFSFMLDETQKKFTWRLDDEGNVIFDERTGDPLVIRPGDEGREFSEDRIIWRNEADKLVEKNSGYFDAVLVSMYPELLSYIPVELRETMGAAIKEAGYIASAGLKLEFENIAAREQRIFTSLRTRDIWSLRKKSDDEAAAVFTEQLIAEAEQVCKAGIENLNVKIEKAYSGSGDLALIGEEWLQLYKEQFDRGLKAWEEAEERFFIRRIEWEQDTERMFSEGEEIWHSAFERINNEYKKWELKAKELFDRGETLFKNASVNLERSITDAKKEFEINKNMRVGTGTEKAKALIDMYLTGASAAVTTKENLQYLAYNFSYFNRKNVDDPDFTDWLWNERKKRFEQLEESIDKFLKGTTSYEKLSRYDKSFFKISNEKEYSEKIIEMNNNLLKIKEIISGKLTFAEETAFVKELENNNYLRDFSFDEYNYARLCEIQKNYNLYASYLEIAVDARDKIIANYAEILGTGALKDILSPDVSTEDFYLDEYQLALIKAKTLVLYWERKTSIAQAIIAYSEKTAAGKMTETESIQAWEKAKTEYNKSLVLYDAELTKLNEIGVNVQAQKTILDKLANEMTEEEEKLNRLSREYSMLVAAGYTNIGKADKTDFKNKYNFLVDEYKDFIKTGEDALYKEVLEYGMNWCIAQKKETAEKILEDSVNEEPENAVHSKTRLAAIDLFADSIGADYILRSFDSVYSGADWYSKAKGIVLSEEEKAAIFGEKLGERLIDDYNKSYLTLLKQRLIYELNIFKNILDIDPMSVNYKKIMASAMSELKDNSLDLDEIEYIYDVLLSFKERLDSNQEFFMEGNDENNIIENFILGETFCVNTENELIDYYNDYDYCSNLLDVYLKYADFSSFAQKEKRQNLFNYIKVFLADYWPDTEGKILPSARCIYESILKRGENLSENTNLFFNELEKYFSASPKWLENEFYFWKNAVLEYIVANISSYEEEDTNEKHWRQYLIEEFIEGIDPVLIGISTLKEGVIEDARFTADYYTNRLNDAFDLFSLTDFSAPTKTAKALSNLYSYASSDTDNRFYSLSFYYKDMFFLGRSLEISKLSSKEVNNEKIIVYNKIKAQEVKYGILKDDYLTEADKFLEIGGLYDKQYNAVKKAYDNTENMRFEYEKEDAIRRWASTSYLGTDTVNYDDCKNKYKKAKVALNVLLEINTKEKRVYDNPEYNALYSEYEQCFTSNLKALDAFETVFSTLAREYQINETYFNNYSRVVLNFGALGSVDNINNWPYRNIITVKNGKLAFSVDSSWTIKDNSPAEEINNFINTKKTLYGETQEISSFEEALRGLSQRMARYLNDPDRLKQWSSAREYIISSLIGANSSLSYFSKYLAGLGKLESGGSLGGELYKSGVTDASETLYSFFKRYKDKNAKQGQLFYASISEEEKADLEFYVILTLTGGGNDYISGFSEMLNVDFYQEAYDKVNGYYKHAYNQSYKWYTLFFYDEMKEINKNTLKRIEPVLDKSKETVSKFIYGIKNNLLTIQYYGDSYFTSCANIKILNGEKETGQNVLWEDINNALANTKKFTGEDINIIKALWEKMQGSSYSSYENLYDALSGLVKWTKNEETRIKDDLEEIWLKDMEKREINENNYFAAADAFISGTGNINALKDAAEKAYGKDSMEQNKYFENIASALINDLSIYLTIKNDHHSEFVSLGNNIQLIIEKILESRFDAELSAREIEWNQMRKDIKTKANEWENTMTLVLERGRADWNAGKQKMYDSYIQWYTNFQNEVRRVDNEWSQAYLAGLEDKETWLSRAAEAFNQASAESFLQLVGTEGERLSRFMDAREPFGVRNALPEAQAIMTNLLQSSGIVNMANAFNSMNNISDTAAIKVRKGLGGVSSWDTAVVKATAKNIAGKTNAEIADAEARKMANTAKKTISEYISGIYTNVNNANRNFRESMDNQFIMDGLWRKNGTNYEKDIVKGSTLFQPVISQRQTVAGYKDYILEPVSLRSNLDENILAELNTIAIRALIESAYEEIKAISVEIFGNDKEKEPDNKSSKESPGLFVKHIGDPPKTKPQKEFGKTKSSYFYDEGEGELGRLMTEFIYWGYIDAKGSAELSIAPWDKRMWNDDNSSFNAPTLRTVGQIAATVAVTIASGGTGLIGVGALGLTGSIAATALVSSSSNILFGTLDAACGYKSSGEAAFDIGKSLLLNSASTAISGVFSSFGTLTTSSVNGTAGRIISETVMTGTQSITASMTSNALNSFTFNDGHIGWSGEIFNSGMKGVFTNALVSMAGTFTTQSLTAVNSGFDLGKLIGFNEGNTIDLGKFNSLAGSLAGQGLNYAMGGDFTLNLLNLTLLTGNDKYNTGLLELHLGRNGTSMNLGTGGANVSLDNLASAFKGLQVWGVNRFIKKQNDFGDDKQKGQLWDILNGEVLLMTDAEAEGLTKDINAYSDGMDYFNSYEDGNYDSSADYFRMYKDNDEKVTKVLDDGDIYHATIGEADGSERTVALQEGSKTAALDSIAGNGMPREQKNDFMVESVLRDEENKAWYAKEDQGKNIPSEVSVNNESGGLGASSTDLRGKVTGLVNYAKDSVFSLFGKIKNTAEGIIGGIGNLLGFKPQPLTPDAQTDAQTDATNYWTVPGGDNKDSLTKFYSDLASIAKDKYKADGNDTFCNKFVKYVLQNNFGDDAYKAVYPDKASKEANTNTLFELSKDNPNLERILVSTTDNLQNIQKMANNGVLIMVVVKNLTGKGHIAFVGPSDLTYNTVYKDDKPKPDYEGWKGTDPKLPLYNVTVVQAGTYSGTTSIRYTTNDWLTAKRKDILNNNMRFYAVKKNNV